MFTKDEFELLNDALNALRASKARDQLMSGMIGAMLARSKEEAQANFESMTKDEDMKDENLEERIILLRAKLIMLRDKREVDEFVSQL